ncbi:MAG: gliding motility lipoprotein GldH [Bacteroidota bacterium]
MKNNRVILQIVVLFIVLFSVSCDKNVLYVENQTLANSVWKKQDKLSFTADIQDTINPINVYLSVRNKGDYSYSNLYLFLNTIFPNGQVSRDTMECFLADPKGKWLGSGIGDIKSVELLFIKNVRFVAKGKYTFEFQQAMRDDELKGIYEFGLKIEKP